MSASSPQRGSWLKARFSFKGRASRREYWLQGLVTVVLFFVTAAITVKTVLAAHLRLLSQGRSEGHAVIWAGLLLLVVDFVLFAWSLFAVDSRRSHDLDRPFIGGVAEIFSLRGLTSRGTSGPNQYGPDPLQEAALPQ
jgi:uncharacterized membrane protein YhaH (DUF805 family)